MLKAKQLAACITGRKDLGGADKKSVLRKQKSSDEQETSTSKK